MNEPKKPADWRDLALQLLSAAQEQGEIIRKYDRAAESLLQELHDTLATTVELLEAGELERCLQAARVALANLENRISRGTAAHARSQIGWTDEADR